jgi:F-type H+-transporting ATPase subunit epsilon
MSNSFFKIKIITPAKTFERQIKYIRLKDDTGSFGIMKGHINFLTALEPSLGYYTDINGREVFIAVDGGILNVRDGVITLTSREVFESDDAEKLGEVIENTIIKRDESEMAFLKLLEGIEKSFIEKTMEFIRESR